MNHRDLCKIGADFLLKSKDYRLRSQYVLLDFVPIFGESPDVFGLQGTNSTILLEIKMSRSDFLRDKKKKHKFFSSGIGQTRYYLCPENIIKPEELPKGFGLLYFSDTIKVIKFSDIFMRDMVHEHRIMYSVIRRLSNKQKLLNFRKN